MSENKMTEVARLAGLELEEEFRMENYSIKYKITKNGFMYWSDEYQQWNYTCGIEELFLGKSQIVKIPKPILDEKEKEYLSAVIKPFRDSVDAIIKCKYDDYYEFIQIEVKQESQEKYEYVNLPNFKKGTMYKGMKIDKGYTLKELGL